jgi:hypothetical protein
VKRNAAPMIGGLVTSFTLELQVDPAIYTLWRRREVVPSAPQWDPVQRPSVKSPSGLPLSTTTRKPPLLSLATSTP